MLQTQNNRRLNSMNKSNEPFEMWKPYKSQNEQLIRNLNNKDHFAIWGKCVKLNVRKRSSGQSADHEKFTKSGTIRVFVVDIIVLPRKKEKVKVRMQGNLLNELLNLYLLKNGIKKILIKVFNVSVSETRLWKVHIARLNQYGH